MHYLPIDTLVKIPPEWFFFGIFPSAKPLFDLRDLIRRRSKQALDELGGDVNKGTIFETLAKPNLPHEERSLERIVDAGYGVMAAGIDSTTSALTFILFHLTFNEEASAKLRDELTQNPQTKLWSDLEKLPHLSSVINKVLRLWMNCYMRLTRSAPEEKLYYKEWIIPPGTLMSSSFRCLHGNPEFFPHPEIFTPERGIDAEFQGKALQAELVPFGKGPRQCLGQK